MSGKIVCFGEILIRFGPEGYLRFLQADKMLVNYTGAEANMAVALSQFGMKTKAVTKFPDNEIAKCAVATMKKFGVDCSDIVYGGDRVGVYYVEKGASQRASKVVYDRKYSSISQASRSDFDWEKILEDASVFIFTGITAALSENMSPIIEDACKVAKAKGIKIVCDLNYRKYLWSPEQAKKVMTKLCSYVDVLVGNEEDADKVLGIKSANTDVTQGVLNKDGYIDVAKQIIDTYGCKTVATTLRTSISATVNNWAGMLYTDGKAYFSKEYNMHIVDRVGGGDSFASGLVYALENSFEPQKALEFAVAASCLKHSIELDFNLTSVSEIETLMNGDGSGRVQR